MRAILFLNGRRVGEIAYDLPRDERGREIPVPEIGIQNEAFLIVVVNDCGKQWFSPNPIRLEERDVPG